jgi:hypothetical protein
MKDIIDDFGKGISLDRSEIVAYRSSQSVIFSKGSRNQKKFGSNKGLDGFSDMD